MSDQPPPKTSDGPAIVDLVLADIHERDILGRQRYGTRLQAHNGRDGLRDAYEESLDKTFYLRLCIEERDKLVAERDRYKAVYEAACAFSELAIANKLEVDNRPTYHAAADLFDAVDAARKVTL